MTQIECPGLNGANPLHFMASLGVLRLLHRQEPETCMAWTFAQGAYRPAYVRPQDDWSVKSLCEELLAWIAELGKTHQPRKDLQQEANRLAKTIKHEDKALRDEIRALRAASRGKAKVDVQTTIAAAFGPRQAALARNRNQLAVLQVQIGDALGQGIAHLGPVIGVSPALFRAKAVASLELLLSGTARDCPATDDAQLVAAAMASLGCDQVTDAGKLTYTPYSFSNGGGGQCLLKDFRACSTITGLKHLLGTLKGEPQYATTVGSLGWDPADQSLHALQWEDPQVANKKGRKQVDPAVQTLAYVGLSLLPAVPGDGLTAVGWHRFAGHKGIRWPIWDAALTLDTVQAVLAMDLIGPSPSLGIPATFQCTVQNPNGKRNFFSPSRSL